MNINDVRDRRQTSSDAHHRLMPPTRRGGGIIIIKNEVFAITKRNVQFYCERYGVFIQDVLSFFLNTGVY